MLIDIAESNLYFLCYQTATPLVLCSPTELPPPLNRSTLILNAIHCTSFAMPTPFRSHLQTYALVVKSISSGKRPPSTAFSQVHEPKRLKKLACGCKETHFHSYQQVSDHKRKQLQQPFDSQLQRGHMYTRRHDELLWGRWSVRYEEDLRKTYCRSIAAQL